MCELIGRNLTLEGFFLKLNRQLSTLRLGIASAISINTTVTAE